MACARAHGVRPSAARPSTGRPIIGSVAQRRQYARWAPGSDHSSATAAGDLGFYVARQIHGIDRFAGRRDAALRQGAQRLDDDDRLALGTAAADLLEQR